MCSLSSPFLCLFLLLLSPHRAQMSLNPGPIPVSPGSSEISCWCSTFSLHPPPCPSALRPALFAFLLHSQLSRLSCSADMFTAVLPVPCTKAQGNICKDPSSYRASRCFSFVCVATIKEKKKKIKKKVFVGENVISLFPGLKGKNNWFMVNLSRCSCPTDKTTTFCSQ